MDPRLHWEELDLTDWQQAYIGLLKEQERGTYGLHDLDLDGQPELLLFRNGEAYDKEYVDVYACFDGKVLLVGSFSAVHSIYDEGIYACTGKGPLLCATASDSIVSGRGGEWVTLSGKRLEIKAAEDKDIPFVERDTQPSPVLDGYELEKYTIWTGEEKTELLVLPLLDYIPEEAAAAPEEERAAAKELIDSVLAGKVPLYAVSTNSWQDHGGWMYFKEYRNSAMLADGWRAKEFYLTDTLSLDMNGDGIDERILFLEEGPGQFDSHRTAVLSVQDGMVYAYQWDRGWEELKFWKDQSYRVQHRSSKVKLLYQTESTYDPDRGIKRTTLDPQGLGVSIYYEIPVFPETSEGYRKINAFFQSLCDDFFAPESGKLARAWEYSYINSGAYGFYDEWTAEVTEQTDKLVSVNLWWTWMMGGVNDRGGEAYTFRTDTGEPLSITDLAEGTEEEIRGAILEALEQYEYFYEPEDVLANAREYPLEDFTVFLTSEGFVIHLARYELGRIGAESDMYLSVEGLSLQSRWQS